MKIAYFRNSKHDRNETLARLRRAAEGEGLTILGESGLPNGRGRVLTICRPQWAETVIDADPNLLGLLPCTVTVLEKEGEVLVGAATPTLLSCRTAPTPAYILRSHIG